jgi:hypothetical protein
MLHPTARPLAAFDSPFNRINFKGGTILQGVVGKRAGAKLGFRISAFSSTSKVRWSKLTLPAGCHRKIEARNPQGKKPACQRFSFVGATGDTRSSGRCVRSTISSLWPAGLASQRDASDAV